MGPLNTKSLYHQIVVRHDYLFVFLASLGIFAIYEPTLFWNYSDHFADAGDAIVNFFFYSSSVRKILAGNFSGYWDANILWPFGNVFALSDNLFFHSLLIAPFYAVGFRLQSLYNISLALFYALNITVFYWAVKGWAKSRTAALLGGLIFMLNLFAYARLPHYQFSLRIWYPLLFLFLLRFWKTPSLRPWLLFVLSVLALALTGPYLFVFALPALVFGGLMLAPGIYAQPRLLTKMALSGIPVAACIFLFYYPYVESQSLYGLVRSPALQASLSANWRSLFAWSDLKWPYHFFGDRGGPREGIMYFGVAIWLSLGISLYALLKSGWINKYRRESLMVMAIFLLTVVYVFASFGPSPRYELLDVSVFKLFSLLPGFSGIRAVGRLAVVVYFLVGLFVAGGLGLLVRNSNNKNLATLLVMGLVVLHVVEHAPPPPDRLARPYLGTEKYRAVSEFFQQVDSNAPVILRPLRTPSADDMLLSAFISNPFVNGTSGHLPFFVNNYIWPALENCTGLSCLHMMKTLGLKYTLVHKQFVDPTGKHYAFLNRSENFRKVYQGQIFEVYESLFAVDPPRRIYGDAAVLGMGNPPKLQNCVRPRGLNSPNNSGKLQALTDDNLATAWDSDRRQEEGVSMEVVLSRESREHLVLQFRGTDPNYENSAHLRGLYVTGATASGAIGELGHISFLEGDAQGLTQKIYVRNPGLSLNSITVHARATKWVNSVWAANELQVCKPTGNALKWIESVKL